MDKVKILKLPNPLSRPALATIHTVSADGSKSHMSCIMWFYLINGHLLQSQLCGANDLYDGEAIVVSTESTPCRWFRLELCLPFSISLCNRYYWWWTNNRINSSIIAVLPICRDYKQCICNTEILVTIRLVAVDAHSFVSTFLRFDKVLLVHWL